MPVVDSYVQGTPSWVELITPDQRAASEFYGSLFGWQMVENPLDDGQFSIVGNLQGDAVAGIGGQMPQLAGHPAFWNVYLAADDVDAVAARVGPAGGTVEVAPYDVADLGRTTALKDPTGARFSLWQPGRRLGTARANEPGTPIWNELRTPDAGRAAMFYADVLGLLAEENPLASGGYATFSAGGRTIAGLTGPPDAGPPHWNVYFNVTDVDESLALADALGGKVLTRPFDAEGDSGRIAVLTDPQGGMFCLQAD